MPTGYTEDLNKGKKVTFQEFVIRCTKPFGNIIERYDEPISGESRLVDHHLKAIKTAKRCLAEVEKLSNAQAEREAKKDFDDEVRSEKKASKKNEEIKRAYLAMLKKVKEWVPPTPDHEPLKDFMIDQLAESMKADCLHTPKILQRLSGKQYRSQIKKYECENIAYHTKEHARHANAIREIEKQPARERGEWMRTLLQSLNGFK